MLFRSVLDLQCYHHDIHYIPMPRAPAGGKRKRGSEVITPESFERPLKSNSLWPAIPSKKRCIGSGRESLNPSIGKGSRSPSIGAAEPVAQVAPDSRYSSPCHTAARVDRLRCDADARRDSAPPVEEVIDPRLFKEPVEATKPAI
ncbi:hypothetical protein TEQG_03071 [Trichophyton equinum CBS 127.97]|uniref:Uncharacterized protein n=1 Tax=Trichophyton equinum (strain ATCC MYA-4606 / CBS 127.97) TaxID=559882 RepID=F2PQ69_TRIEC|nr:hypothetical protein TEQG_03071 [Trichophyton equinum CBS 127.97]